MPGGVVFFGYGELGAAGVDALVARGAKLAAVVVPGNRHGPDVERMHQVAARERTALLVQPPRAGLRPFVEALRETAPELMVVWSYSMKLPAQLLAIPPLGAVNLHGGLLPEYRGGHVVQWALLNGERESGVTLHYMDEGIDTGPVIAERRFGLEDTDDAESVREKIRTAGSTLLAEWWPRLLDGTAPRVPQDESRARYWRMRMPEDGRIDWAMSATFVWRLVRALRCNTPGPFVEVAGRKVSIRGVEPTAHLVAQAPPGEIVEAGPSGVRVAVGGGDILITAAELDGRTLPAAELAGLLRAGASYG
jgi:methionyl-tRNA formyltransferase